MSKYRRDDQKFREQIAALADAGLTFPTAPAKLPEYPLHFDGMATKLVGAPGSLTIGIGHVCSLYRARPCSECVVDMAKLEGETMATITANFKGTPAYVRTLEPQPKSKKFDVAGLTCLLLSAALFIASLAAAYYVFFGGAH